MQITRNPEIRNKLFSYAFFLISLVIMFQSYVIGIVILLSTFLYFCQKVKYFEMVFIAFLTSCPIFSLEYASDTLTYYQYFISLIDGNTLSASEGFEIGYVIYNEVISSVTANFDLFLFFNYMFIQVLVLSLVYSIFESRLALLGYIYLSVSPNFIENINLIIRNYDAIAILFFSLRFVKFRYGFILYLTSLLFHLSNIVFSLVFFDKITRVLLDKRMLLISLFILLCNSLGVFNYSHFVVESLASISSLSGYIARKLMFVNEISTTTTIYSYLRYILIIIGLLLIDKSNLDLKSIRLLSVFALCSYMVCLFPFGDIVIIRFGLIPYLFFFIFSLLIYQSSKENLGIAFLYSKGLLAYSLLIPTYSFIYNDFISTSPLLASGSYLSQGFLTLVNSK